MPTVRWPSQQAGITWDATPKVSGADTQPAYTPRVQLAKAKGSTYHLRRVQRRGHGADAQGGQRPGRATAVKVWACSLACYTKAFLAQGGSDVEGTYVWMRFLPFEEASYNAEDQAYVTAVGPSKVDILRRQRVGRRPWPSRRPSNAVVPRATAPTALTRAPLLMTALKGMTNFTADGWIGAKALQGPGASRRASWCMQVQNGKFVRVYPTKPGTMDCNPANNVTVTVDASAVAASLK